VGVKNSPFLENSQNSGIQNALKSEGIAYNASSRNFIFANLAKKSFSAATPDFDSGESVAREKRDCQRTPALWLKYLYRGA